MPHTIVSNEGESNVTVFIPGEAGLFTAHSDHPNFKAIVALCLEGREDESIDLFDIATTVSQKFERLSERVTVANGRVYFDGDEVDTSLTNLIVRALSEGSDFRSLVAFLEKVEQNPNAHSREQLWDWLRAYDFTISATGDIVGYKGVSSDGKGGYQSGWAGTAIVDGESITGHIPNAVGSIVEMPRTAVAHDPGAACSTGLHVGTFDYASHYSRSGAMLEVHVNPRDVVSVPTDAAGEKVRVCRYVVVGVIDAPYNSAVLAGEWDDDDEGDYNEDAEVTVTFTILGEVADAIEAVTGELQELADEASAIVEAAEAIAGTTVRDDQGRFVQGRPGSQRDSSGRFAG